MIRVAHISDLHFHESGDAFTGHYRHSLQSLKAIEELFDKEAPDHVVVTGDITNIGDPINLERAYQWIHDKIYSTGDYYGLNCVAKGRGVLPVPGNHDAFNARYSGNELNRWQRSLDNYYSAFQEYRYDEGFPGVGYKWVKKDDVNLFFCLIDSCYLGDPDTEPLGLTLNIGRIAKGKISKNQSEAILRIYDRGIAGELRDSEGVIINPGEFLSSLKIIVMHHYLFEPADARAEPLLQLNDKKITFLNIAMSDFDILLCGHKHIADIQVIAYSDKFDVRAKIRLAFNHVRRTLGIRSLPLRYDVEGQTIGKYLRFILGLLIVSKSKNGPLTDSTMNDILAILEKSLSDPSALRIELLKFLSSRSEIREAGLFDKQEVLELYAKMKKTFTTQQRKDIKTAADKLRGIIARLSGRPFAHIMSASSAKSSEIGTRHRAVNFYDFHNNKDDEAYRVEYRRFSWDEGTNAFLHAFQQDILFPHGRISL